MKNKEKPSWTFALELLMSLTRGHDRREAHGTFNGVRSVVSFEGQMYEVLVNPLHEYDLAPEPELGNGGEPVPAEVNEDQDEFAERKCCHDRE